MEPLHIILIVIGLIITTIFGVINIMKKNKNNESLNDYSNNQGKISSGNNNFFPDINQGDNSTLNINLDQKDEKKK